MKICNKCNQQLDVLNDLEQQEYIENGSFICSDCINQEMEEK
jgi:superfamily II helicase